MLNLSADLLRRWLRVCAVGAVRACELVRCGGVRVLSVCCIAACVWWLFDVLRREGARGGLTVGPALLGSIGIS